MSEARVSPSQPRVSPPRLMLRHTLDYGAFDVTLWRVYCWVGERWKPTEGDERFLALIPNYIPNVRQDAG